MSSAAEQTVALAVRMLPRELRERYREQWAADLRDAAEVGISPGSVAIGALSFAATVDRPLPPSIRNPGPDGVRHRGRLALALALSATLLGFTRYLDMRDTGRVVSEPIYFVLTVSEALFAAWMVFAPVVAVLTVAITRQMPARIRIAVIVLALVAIATLLQVRAVLEVAPHFYFPYEEVTHPLALTLITVAVLAWVLAGAVLRESPLSRRAARRRIGTTLIAAGAVGALGSLVVASAVTTWVSRTPIVFGAIVGPDNQEWYEEWLAVKLAAEGVAHRVLVASGVAVALLVVALIVGGVVFRWSRARIVVVTCAMGVLIAVGYSGLSTFFGLYTGTAAAVLDPLAVLVIARFCLVAVVLVGVGHVRFTGRHRVSSTITS